MVRTRGSSVTKNSGRNRSSESQSSAAKGRRRGRPKDGPVGLIAASKTKNGDEALDYKGHRSNPEATPRLILDPWRAELRDRRTNALVKRLARWARREQTIFCELYLTSKGSQGGLNLIEIATIWPDWLDAATRLQDVRKLMGPVVWRINNQLAEAGLSVKQGRDMTWTVEDSRPTGHERIVVTLDEATHHIELCKAAMQARAYDDVAALAEQVLEIYPDSLAANILLGRCGLVHEVPVNDELLPRVAEFLIERRGNLDKAVFRLSALWKYERRRGRWEFVVEQIHHIEEELRQLESVFSAAEDYLRS